MNGCLLYSVSGEVLGSGRGIPKEMGGVYGVHCCPGLSHTLTFVCAVSCKLRHDELPAARCMPCGAVAQELLAPL